MWKWIKQNMLFCENNEPILRELNIYKAMTRRYKFDFLTGLKLRHDFVEETTHKFKHQEFYLMMTDITGLHQVNREQGYKAGDAVIKSVSDELKSMKGVWEAYRIGGDEFMTLSFCEPKCDIENATSAFVQSKYFKSLDDALEEVDRLVTQQKIKLNRRR